MIWGTKFKIASHLVVSDDGVELAEGGEAEEGVDYVGRQVDRGLPLFPENWGLFK